MALILTWLGHGTWSFDADGRGQYRSGSVSEKPHNPSAQVTANDLSPQFILVTHGHGDHVADLVALAKSSGAVICNFEIGEWLGRKVMNVHAMNFGGAHTFPFGRVKMTIAHHSSMLPDGANGGNPCGYLLSFNHGHDLYFAGDTALTYDMRLIGEVGGWIWRFCRLATIIRWGRTTWTSSGRNSSRRNRSSHRTTTHSRLSPWMSNNLPGVCSARPASTARCWPWVRA